jgi:hypothetical protein
VREDKLEILDFLVRLKRDGKRSIDEVRPDVVLILPWNLRDEVVGQLQHIREWGGRFALRAPELTLLP